MKPQTVQRNISQIYLTLVPFLAALLAFGIGHVSYKIYLPIWLIHACLMVVAAWTLGAHGIRSQNGAKKQLAVSACFFIIPWLFISVFAGMGPPPTTAAGWVASATEQQVRYAILLSSGIVFTLGFALLRNQLKQAGDDFYSLLSLMVVLMAIPLFMLNMTYWGSFLTEAFRLLVDSTSQKRPDWYLPVRAQFNWISTVEVALTYLATTALAVSLNVVGWLRPVACRFYIGISLFGFLLSLSPSSSFDSLTIAGYLVSIPAFPFIMPYLMAVNLLRRVGNSYDK